jgi:hypothetical protein
VLGREIVKGFLEDELEGIERPENVTRDELLGAFCEYVEEDLYEWLKDNFKSFFNHGDPDWDWIKNRMEMKDRS